MKNLLKTVLAVAAIAFMASCDKNALDEETYLEVTPFNIEGIWELTELNGVPMGEGVFAYMEFVRQDRKFTRYHNFDSFATVVETVKYDIYIEDNSIRGYYDHSFKEQWKHSYIISELTSERMVWTAEDDENEVRVYMRIDKLPDGIASDSEDDGQDE